MEIRGLLDEAFGLQHLSGCVVPLEDCVEASASFVLHHLLKRSENSENSQEICVIDLDGDNGKGGDGGLVSLYGKILKTISAVPQENKNCVTVMIDDVSLMEVAARGSTNLVLDFLHYCHTLVSEFRCSLIILNHEDIYSSMVRPTLILHVEYLADILIKAEPLATGLALDVHGQLDQETSYVIFTSRSRKSVLSISILEAGHRSYIREGSQIVDEYQLELSSLFIACVFLMRQNIPAYCNQFI